MAGLRATCVHRIGAHLKSAQQCAQSVGEGDVRVRQHAAEAAGFVKEGEEDWGGAREDGSTHQRMHTHTNKTIAFFFHCKKHTRYTHGLTRPLASS